jgi:hypothetical protein
MGAGNRARVLQIADEDLGGEAAVSEDEGLQAAIQEAESEAACLGDIAAANPQLLIDDRGVVESEEALALGRAVRFDLGYGLFDELFGQFFGIGDGRRAADETRL